MELSIALIVFAFIVIILLFFKSFLKFSFKLIGLVTLILVVYSAVFIFGPMLIKTGGLVFNASVEASIKENPLFVMDILPTYYTVKLKIGEKYYRLSDIKPFSFTNSSAVIQAEGRKYTVNDLPTVQLLKTIYSY